MGRIWKFSAEVHQCFLNANMDTHHLETQHKGSFFTRAKLPHTPCPPKKATTISKVIDMLGHKARHFMAGCPADYFDLDVSWHQQSWVAWGIPHGGLFQNAACLDSRYPETHASFFWLHFGVQDMDIFPRMYCNRMVRVFGALCREASILHTSYKHHASFICILWIHHTCIMNGSYTHTS